MNQTLKAILIGITTTLAFAATANQAQALDFTFSGYDAGSFSSSGTFTIKDSAVSSGTLSQSDIEDWEINITDGANSTTLFGDGGSFGTDNSSILAFNGGTATASTLQFNGALDIRTDTGVSPFAAFRQLNPTKSRLAIGSFGEAGPGSTLVANANATPVPFGVEADMGLLILGGMWGASRLRKKMAA